MFEKSMGYQLCLSSFRAGLLAAIGLTGCSSDTTGASGTDTDDTQGSSASESNSNSESNSSSGSNSNSESDSNGESWSCDNDPEFETFRRCIAPPGATTGDDTSTGGSTSGTGSAGSDTDTDTDGGSSTGPGFGSTGGTSEGTTGATSGSTGADPSAGLCDIYGTELPSELDHDGNGGWVDDWEGPTEEDGQCCYTITYRYEFPCGRPFVVEGKPRVGSVANRSDWCASRRPELHNLDASARAELSRLWLEDAQAEHASIASFARFALELLALGAPPSLLADTHEAMDDELEHARLCFGLASAYGSKPLGPGPLALDGTLGAIDIATVVEAALNEGCIGETLAAVQAQVAATRATDPAVRATLETIAADEAKHAALAWRFVRWALQRDAAVVRPVVEQAIAALIDPAPVQAGDDAIAVDVLHAHGRLGREEQASLRSEVLRQVVLPCARTLLASGSTQALHAVT